MRSGIAGFEPHAPDHFFLPRDYTDPFENVTKISFDSRDLYVESSKDARDNETRVLDFDFRVLAPNAMQDITARSRARRSISWECRWRSRWKRAATRLRA